jgi:hypothetical protein
MGSLAFFISGGEGKIQANGTEEAKLCLNCSVEKPETYDQAEILVRTLHETSLGEEST